MENSADALKIAFAVFVFVIAISITFMVLAQAKSTADTVMYYSDNTNFQDHYNGEGEVVGVDNLITTLYKYNKESLAITIKDNTAAHNIIAIFDTTIEGNCPWNMNSETQKQRIDAFVTGINPVTINGKAVKFDNLFKYDINSYADKKLKATGVLAVKSLPTLVENMQTAKFTKSLIEVDTSGEYKTPSDYELDGTELTDDGTILQVIPGGKKVYITYTLN